MWFMSPHSEAPLVSLLLVPHMSAALGNVVRAKSTHSGPSQSELELEGDWVAEGAAQLSEVDLGGQGWPSNVNDLRRGS